MKRPIPFAALASGLIVSSCTCEPDKPPLPEARVDSLFRFEDDAFSFANFGGRGQGAAMNPDLLERLHGKVDICEPSSSDCRLTPLAKEYMRSVNEAMEGGRCEGFAILSGFMATGDIDVTAFGGNSARELELDGNRALGGEIAYWFSTQFLGDVVQGSTRALTGEDAVRFLTQAYTAEGSAPFRIGIARVDPAGFLTGGHAILATGVGPGDDDGTYSIFVYDNNLPDAERAITVDVNAGTWRYEASTNPDDPAALYQGTPDNGNVLFIAELPPRQGEHPCAFCESEASLQQVFGSAGAVVSVEGESGAQSGEVNGVIVNEVEGSATVPLLSETTTDRAGTMTVMPRQAVTLTIGQGDPDEPGDVAFYGPGTLLQVENMTFGDDGTGEAIVQTNEDATEVAFVPADEGQGCSVTVGSIDEDGGQKTTSVTIPEGESVDGLFIATDENGNPTIDVESEDDTTIDVEVSYSGPDGTDSYSGSLEVQDGGSATLLIDEWAEQGGELGAEVDEDGDGTPDQTVVVDETDPLVPPAAPTGLVATAQGASKIALSWQDVATDELAYEIERDDGDGDGFVSIDLVPANSTAALDIGLEPSTAYSYRVRALGAQTVSDYSNVATATTEAISSFAIGGTVTGLQGTVVVRNRGNDDELSIDQDGTFVLPTEQASGDTYDVVVVTQPEGQRCNVDDGLGVVAAAVTTVRVSCVDVFLVGGTVEGIIGELVGGGMILENNGGDFLTVDGNGEFIFTTPVGVGEGYDVAVRRQPPGHACTVENGEGIIDGDVTDVLVLCAPVEEGFLVGGIVNAPSFTQIVIRNLAGDDVVTVPGDATTFVFERRLQGGEAYDVVADGDAVTCTVENGEGTVAGEVDDIEVSCVFAPVDLALVNPSPLPDALPADVNLAGVEFDVRMAEPFVPALGTPAGFELRDAGSGALAATGTWSLRDGGTEDARIVFVAQTPSVTLGAARIDGVVRGNPFGGALFNEACPAGQAPIGFDAAVDGYVRGVSVVCGALQFDPVTLEVTIGAESALPRRGDQRSATDVQRCPSHTVVVGFSGRAGSLIDRADLQCAGLTVTGTSPDFSVEVGAPVSGGGFGGQGGDAFDLTSCGPGEIASGFTVRAGDGIDALGLRCSQVGVGFSVALGAGDYDLSLSSTFSLDGEPPAVRVVATASEPLRVLPRGLTSVEPAEVLEGSDETLLGLGVAVYGDSIVLFNGERTEGIFRGLLTPGFCDGPTQAGCILQQAPFSIESEPAGVYAVCVVPGVDPENPSTLPSSCPPGSPTLTIRQRPGTPDRSFSSVELPRLFATNETAGAVDVDAQGNMYITGLSDGDAMVAKVTVSGFSEFEFGGAGFALAGLTTASAAPGCIDIGPDGAVTIATALDGTTGDLHVVRFTPPGAGGIGGGQIDDTYAGGGLVLDDPNTNHQSFVVQGCKRMSDGRLVIGAAYEDSTQPGSVLQSLWRLEDDGTFADSKFLDDSGFTFEQGMTLVAGPNDTGIIVGRLDANAGFLRFDNSPDMFVGGWRSVVLAPDTESALSDAVLDSSGSFVAVGATFDAGVEQPRAVRVGANNSVSLVVAFDAGSSAQGPYRMAQDAEGRLVVVSRGSAERPNLVRLDSALSLDTTWGVGGLSSSTALDAAIDIVIDPAGRVVVAGHGAYDSDFDGVPDVSAIRVERFVSGP